MWHEARRREKATQKLLNDHKKRAEKRRGENRIDPNSLLQVHGIKAKLCLDPTVYKQAVKSLVVWQGDKSITIDRFDVRATLSSIPSDSPCQSKSNQRTDKNTSTGRSQTVLDLDESESIKKILNYERYRLLIQSDLNKVPEELRLKLVTDSDVLSDAKMRKLRNNKFGTSGETSITTGQSQHFNNQRISQFRDPVKRVGAAIGFTYNSVPPPSSLSDASGDTNATQHEHTSMIIGDSVQASYMDILDLVDNDNFDLESVNVVSFDSKRIDEIARKYSLSGQELILLAKRDSLEAGCASDIIRELDRLKNESDSTTLECDSYLGKCDDQVYGPALPPNLVASASQNLDKSSPSPSSTSHSSPVRQRSPTGIGDIPLRNGHLRSESSESSGQPDSRIFKLDTGKKESSLDHDQQNASMSIKDGCSIEPSSDRQTRLEDLINVETEGKSGERKSDHISPRRASTPLAYKKNCRSSRSLSRERRSRRRKSSTRRRRKNRSTSTSSSSSSPSSRSSKSSYPSRQTSGRKRKSRYKRDSYR